METSPADIAVVGMACRLPGADDPDQYWRNLREGVESIRPHSEQTMLAAGVSQHMLNNPRYVRASAPLRGADTFDAAFFGFSAREAELMDPQHRIFLECSHAALEDAGHDPARYEGLIGVYAGSTMNTYILMNLVQNQSVIDVVGDLQTMIGNDKEYLASRVSYKLGLRGPSCVVQTACSTSLVAIHVASQAILAGECDMAVVGGSSVRMPLGAGYLYQPGGTSSPDGHCRAFDAAADGSVVGSGVGVVVLKHLDDAVRDGDHVYAVIKGTAINNDGDAKASFTAPSVEGQARAAASALLAAGLTGDDIDYVEAHGTGTPLGDPIEVAALTRSLRETTDRRQDVVLGSVKTNIGHLDAAAGIAGFIKTVQSVRYGLIPPTLNFRSPNPQIDFAGSPFYVTDELVDWPDVDRPRRAAVNSIGMGGTNAHVVIQQAPSPVPPEAGPLWQLLRISAATGTALEASTGALATWLRENPSADLADVAHTLDVGRRPMPYRRTVVARDVEDAAAALGAPGSARVVDAHVSSQPAGIVFLFPGQGAQRVGMGAAAYASSPEFGRAVDELLSGAPTGLADELRDLVLGSAPGTPEREQQLANTRLAQPALFLVSYCWARVLMAHGVIPTALLGHSIGELVAAAVAGALAPADAFALVIARGELVSQQSTGAMVSVLAPIDTVYRYLGDELDIAAVNGPELVTVSGATDAIEALQDRLTRGGVQNRRLVVSHAFHSRHMQGATNRLRELAAGFPTAAPTIPMLANVTGDWHPAAPIDPAYWGEHLRQTVDFAACLERLSERPSQVLLEVGPGEGLSALAQTYALSADWATTLSTLPTSEGRRASRRSMLETFATLWRAGLRISEPVIPERGRQRLSLPTYPFERKRYWIAAEAAGSSPHRTAVSDNPQDWFYAARWQELGPPLSPIEDDRLVSVDALPAQDELQTLVSADETTALVLPAPVDLAACATLLRAVAAAARNRRTPLRLALVTRGAGGLLDRGGADPMPHALAALALVAAQESPNLRAGVVALDEACEVTGRLLDLHDPPLVVVRGGRRWGQAWKPIAAPGQAALEECRVVVLGGLGLFGRRVASHLLKRREAHVWLLDIRSEADLDREEQAELARLRTLGPLTVLKVDATDPVALAAALEPMLARQLTAVVLAAGPLNVPPTAVGDLTDKDIADQTNVRTGVVEAVTKLLAESGPGVAPHVIAISSLATVLGGLGSGAYAAANELVAALVGSRADWTVVDWEHWERPGEVLTGAMARHAMNADLVGAALETVMSLRGYDRLAVSTADLDERISRGAEIRQVATEPADALPVDPHAHPRPEVKTPFVSAADAIEKSVADNMMQLLGIDRVGVADNFFELGGDSLMAMQLISRLRDQHNVPLPMAELFADPSARALASTIREHSAAAAAPAPPVDLAGATVSPVPVEHVGSAERDGIAALYAEIEDMSDEQVAQQLASFTSATEEP